MRCHGSIRGCRVATRAFHLGVCRIVVLALAVLGAVPRVWADAPRAVPRGPLRKIELCGGIEKLVRHAGELPFAPGEQLAFDLTVSGVGVGRLETIVGPHRVVAGRPTLTLFGRARTNAIVSEFQRFEGRMMAAVDVATFEPVGVRVDATYGEDRGFERAQFADGAEAIDLSWHHRGRDGGSKWVSNHRLIDVLSLLYAARVYALRDGQTACQDVYGARRLWRMRATSKGMAEIDTPTGRKRVRVVSTEFVRRTKADERDKGAARIELELYLADDASRVPLEFTVRTKNIEAKGRLVRWSTDATREPDWTTAL